MNFRNSQEQATPIYSNTQVDRFNRNQYVNQVTHMRHSLGRNENATGLDCHFVQSVCLLSNCRSVRRTATAAWMVGWLHFKGPQVLHRSQYQNHALVASLRTGRAAHRLAVYPEPHLWRLLRQVSHFVWQCEIFFFSLSFQQHNTSSPIRTSLSSSLLQLR